MRFVALDVETANADLASICQVGIAIFQDGEHASSWSSLVNPDDEFDPFNVQIHGIDAQTVVGSPEWPAVAAELRPYLSGSTVACHTPFDRAAIGRACDKHYLPQIDCKWLDTARVVRRAWPEQFAIKGYGLRNVAKFLGIDFKHHDALEDARAAGEVLCRASSVSGLSVEEWGARVQQPIGLSNEKIARIGNDEGPLFGNVVVFTGSLTIPRREAAEIAATAGCDVASSVTKRTTLLVVGDQDTSRLAGKSKNSKHLKAEQLIAQGCLI